MGKYIACICEGGAERAILDLLLDSHKLIFEREELIEEEVLRCRSGKEFEKRYLRKGFNDKITIYRILDSRSEKFNLSKAYEPKVDIKNVITAPEIEKLIICNEGKIKDYERESIINYFSDMEVLLNALHEYRRVSKVRANEMTIWDLLKFKK